MEHGLNAHEVVEGREGHEGGEAQEQHDFEGRGAVARVRVEGAVDGEHGGVPLEEPLHTRQAGAARWYGWW